MGGEPARKLEERLGLADAAVDHTVSSPAEHCASNAKGVRSDSVRTTQVVHTVMVATTWGPFPRCWARLAGNDNGVVTSTTC